MPLKKPHNTLIFYSYGDTTNKKPPLYFCGTFTIFRPTKQLLTFKSRITVDPLRPGRQRDPSRHNTATSGTWASVQYSSGAKGLVGGRARSIDHFYFGFQTGMLKILKINVNIDDMPQIF